MTMHRTFSIAKRAAQTDAIEMAFASEIPYERWWGIEVLDCSPEAVRLDRLNDGAPLLFNHDPDELRGTHVRGSVRCDTDKVVRGKVMLDTVTQCGQECAALVDAGILTKASVGYQIYNVIEQTTTKNGRTLTREIDGATFERLIDAEHVRSGKVGRGDRAAFRRALDQAVRAPAMDPEDDQEGEPVYRVVDWEPFENSLVTVPADNSVGVGRSVPTVVINTMQTPAAAPAQPVSPPAAPAASLKGVTNVTTVAQDPAAGTQAAPQPSITAMQAEKERREAIQDLCKGNKIDPRVEERWIQDGTPLAQVARELVAVLEERGRAKPTAASALGLSSKETQQYSIFRAIRALRFGSTNPEFMNEAAFEIECSRAVSKQLGKPLTSNILVPGEVLTRPLGREAAQRAMATTPGSKGGYGVGIEQLGFVDVLRNRSVALRMGARQLPGLVGNGIFLRQTGKATVTWQGGEGASITATDQTLGQLSLNPKTAIAITDVSEQLLRQMTPSAEAFVMADLAADIAIDGVDNAVINGTGGAQPLGIKNTTGVTTGQDAASATYAKVLAFVSTAGGANAIRGNPGFVTNTAGAARLMQVQRFTSTDSPVWTGNMLDGQLVGFNAMSSEQLASGNLIFGSWDEVVIGDWGVLELAMDNGGTRFNQAQVGIRAMWMVDVCVRYPQAFVVSTNLS